MKKLNSIIAGDSSLELKKIKSNFFDIAITSPPYNAGYDYDNYDDTQEIHEYEKTMKKIFRQIYRILKDGGRFCLNVPFAIKNKANKNVYFIAAKLSLLAESVGFKNFEYIVWHKGNNKDHFQGNNTAWGSWKSPSSPSFRPLCEAVLVFYKKEKRHLGNKENIDITGEEFKEWTKNLWYLDDTFKEIVYLSNNSSKKKHPAPFPEELVERLLKMYSYVGDNVIDPFNGIGTTTTIAKRLKRNFLGIELSENYCNIARERLSDEN